MKLFSWPFGSDEEAQEKERAEFLEYVQRIKEKRERLTWDCPFCKELVPLFEKRCTKCDGERPGKVVVFIRHGQGVHNLSIWKAMWTRDAVLTELGLFQCKAMSEAVGSVPFDICLVSPLRRTIQTANGVFENSETRLHLCPVHTEYFESRASCNEGSVPAVLLEEFPILEKWGGLKELGDAWWPTKESDVNWKVERTGKFRQLLLDLTEDNVCVVGHGAFTHALLRLKYVPKNCQVIFTRFVQGTFEVLD